MEIYLSRKCVFVARNQKNGLKKWNEELRLV